MTTPVLSPVEVPDPLAWRLVVARTFWWAVLALFAYVTLGLFLWQWATT